MADMFKKVNGSSLLPRWYHIGPKLHSSDREINEVIKRFYNKPMMLICDMRGTKGRIHLILHLPPPAILDQSQRSREIGVEYLLRDVTSLSSHSDASLSSIVHLHPSSLHPSRSRLLEISDYLKQVLLSKMEMNIENGCLLQDIFNLLSGLEAVDEQGSGTPVTVKHSNHVLALQRERTAQEQVSNCLSPLGIMALRDSTVPSIHSQEEDIAAQGLKKVWESSQNFLPKEIRSFLSASQRHFPQNNANKTCKQSNTLHNFAQGTNRLVQRCYVFATYLIVHASVVGKLVDMPRKLGEQEREELIQHGTVFVFEEGKSGMM
ncbi:hypothetical protein BT69DRAFT_1292328 [Atractiella rhizophila]|nr:hypothetical protein BT69DRAFT_1292328 [Atractiella rhizophila]